ncbi:MAG: hypothetical protein EHM72_03835 [Calditrichaeota bacterium]|nr:MAG: hypothetical protein EHM72_03835 [Calditrichota bacterium]
MPILTAQFFNSAHKHSQMPALFFKETTISYDVLLESVQRLASGLHQLGVEKGDRVAIMLPNVPHFCICYYAILSLGAVVVPLNFMHDVDEIHHQLSDSGAQTLILWQGFYASSYKAYSRVPTCKTIIYLGDKIPGHSLSLTQIIASSSPEPPAVDLEESDMAVIHYTSGISDIALGAELSHDAIAANSSTCVEMFRINGQDRLVAALPLFHPLGQTLIMHASFTAGAGLVLLPRFQPLEVVRAIQTFGVTFMPAVPALFRALIELQGDDLEIPSLKYCMSYGGFLALETLQDFEKKYHVTILKAYGLTEAGPLVSSSRISQEAKPESAGLPLVGVEVQIRNESSAILRPNQCGEIFVKSPSLMRGYHSQAAESQKRLQNGWLATGDIGYIDIEHNLFIQERKDDIILKGGFEIFPREVERVLADFPGVSEVAVIAITDPIHGSEVKAFIVPQKDKKLDAHALQEYCQSYLPVYKCPKYVEFIDALPKSPTGRVLKRFLRAGSASKAAKPSAVSESEKTV